MKCSVCQEEVEVIHHKEGWYECKKGCVYEIPWGVGLVIYCKKCWKKNLEDMKKRGMLK